MPTTLTLWQVGLLAAAVLALACQPARAQEPSPPIGPTAIRFYSGNLSVGEFMAYWGTGPAGRRSGATPEMNALLQRCSCSAMCDYLAWCLTEQEPGQWDWSLYEANQGTLAEGGIDYNIFAWLHFPPKWFLEDPRFVPYANLATGRTIPQLSLWAPYTLEIYDEFYRRLAGQFGDRIAFLRLAMPSEYGEVGYCAGMTHWLRPQPDAGPGYWCGDPHAAEDFRRTMLARHGSLQAINRAWGTAFQNETEVSFPDVSRPEEFWRAEPAARARWLDFADWYHQAWVEFMGRAVEVVRRYFPTQEIIISLGYASERLCFGNDQGRLVAAMAELGVSAQTPGDVGYLATRRVSSACRAYGVPYYTEPPGDVPPERQVNRLWMDASNGTQTWFDYPQNLDRARDLFVRYKQHLTGRAPVCDLALWLPTLDHWLHPDQAWPGPTAAVADHLRDRTDYEVVDDRLIRDGALDRLRIRLLVLAGAGVVDGTALESVMGWVKGGGVLLVLADSVPVLPHGALADLPAAGDPSRIFRVGEGGILSAPFRDVDPATRSDLISRLSLNLADFGPFRNAPAVDGIGDGILTTLLPDRILLLNTAGEEVTHRVPLRPGDLELLPGRPASGDLTVTLRPGEIGHLLLERRR